MLAALPSLSPLWRSSLRIWLATTLASAILLWSGRDSVVTVAMILAVMFVNENDLTPLSSTGQVIAGALIGILTAQVLHELSTGWLALGIALLLSGILVRSLGLLKGLSTSYLTCWALDVLHQGNQVNWAVVFDLAFAAVVGILMAHVATWAVWPRRPLQQLPALEAQLAGLLSQQITATRQWLAKGGPPPPALRSQALLPRIEQFQRLPAPPPGRGSGSASARLVRRWRQEGLLWSQILRQWLVLERLLTQLPAPLPAQGGDPLLLATLAELADGLAPLADANQLELARRHTKRDQRARRWLEQATGLGASRPLLLAIGQQAETLGQLLQARTLLNGAIDRLAAAPGAPP
jgi:hypothetical protein